MQPVGWPSAIAPPFGFTRSGFGPHSFCQASTTRRERLVHLEDVHVLDAEAGLREHLARRGDRALQHRHRVDADERRVDDARARARPSASTASAEASSTADGAVRHLRRRARGVHAARARRPSAPRASRARSRAGPRRARRVASRRSACPRRRATGASIGTTSRVEAALAPRRVARAPGCAARSGRCPRA